MIWICLVLLVLFAIALWQTWNREDSGAGSDCGVSLLDWFDLF